MCMLIVKKILSSSHCEIKFLQNKKYHDKNLQFTSNTTG